MFLVAGVLRKFLPGVVADGLGLLSFLVLDYFFAGIFSKKIERPIHKLIDTKIFKKERK